MIIYVRFIWKELAGLIKRRILIELMICILRYIRLVKVNGSIEQITLIILVYY
jgi:hypothetical protein